MTTTDTRTEVRSTFRTRRTRDEYAIQQLEAGRWRTLVERYASRAEALAAVERFVEQQGGVVMPPVRRDGYAAWRRALAAVERVSDTLPARPVLVEAVRRACEVVAEQFADIFSLTRHGEAVVTVADLLAAMRSTSDDDEDAYSRLLARLGLDWESD